MIIAPTSQYFIVTNNYASFFFITTSCCVFCQEATISFKERKYISRSIDKLSTKKARKVYKKGLWIDQKGIVVTKTETPYCNKRFNNIKSTLNNLARMYSIMPNNIVAIQVDHILHNKVCMTTKWERKYRLEKRRKYRLDGRYVGKKRRN